MNTKVVWLTSVAVWFWLTPAVRSVELDRETPELDALSEQETLAPEQPDSQSASDLLPLQPTLVISQPTPLSLAEPQADVPQPLDLSLPQSPLPDHPPDQPPDQPLATDSTEMPVAEMPSLVEPVLPEAAAKSDPPIADLPLGDSNSLDSGEAWELSESREPTHLREPSDSMEHWSTEAWMDLLLDETQPTVTKANPKFDPVAVLSQPQPTVHQPRSQNTLPQSRPEPIPLSAEPTPFESTSATVADPPEFDELFESADPLAQITSVSQLADVQPTDWAYQALQSLVERYGAIAGYPDGTFKGERALTRYEFAAGVNAAMDRITELISASSSNAVPESDLAVLNRLQEDFATELISLRGRLDGLEARLAEVAANQFSTTVVLSGQTTFALADAWGGDPPGLGETNPVFAYLAQLQLSGSFSKRDAFKLDFDAGNFAGGGFANPQALNTQMALMGFQTDTDNTLELSGAEYRFAVGDRLVLTFKPVGFGLNSVLSPNSIFSSSTQGALSRFAAETPIFRMGSLDAGLGLDLLMTDRTRLQMAYGARNASDPDQGLFDSDHRAFGVQLLARPFRTVTTGFAYVNAFAGDGFLDTFTGSTNADTSGGFVEPAAIHALSGTLQWQIASSVILAAWGGAAVTDSLSSDAVALSSTYQFSLGFPDTFGREGDLLGVMVGQPFRLRYGLLIEREDEASGLHYEIFYRIRVNDNIAITPGVFVVTDPGHIAENNTIVVGAIRTAFSF